MSGGEVGRLAVGADQDPVLVVAELGCAQPDRAFALVDVAALAQLLDRALDRARLAQRALRGPACRSARRSAPASPRSARASLGRRDLERLEVVRVRALGGELGGELGDVVARVAVLGRLLAAHPGRDRRGEQAHLGAGVVDVVLALDLVAGCARAAAPASRRRRRRGRSPTVTGPVGLALTNSTRIRSGGSATLAPSRSPAASIPAAARAVPAVGEEQVEEAGAGDLDPLDAAAEASLELDPQPLGDLPRRRAQRSAPAASPRWSSSRRARASAAARGSASGPDRRRSPQRRRARRRAAR